ncbi:MAG TPA: hypothetical protein VH297_00645 [Gaiellaceae bacterium]
MLRKLMERFRRSNARAAARKDEAATQRALLERERAERDMHRDGVLPSETRSNADWTYLGPQ